MIKIPADKLWDAVHKYLLPGAIRNASKLKSEIVQGDKQKTS